MGILTLNLQHFAATGFAPNWMNKYNKRLGLFLAFIF